MTLTALVETINKTDWFSGMLDGDCYLPMRKWVTHADRGSRRLSVCRVYPGNGSVDAWWLGGLYNDGEATFDTIAARWDDVAVALTDSWRIATLNDYGLAVKITVNGTVWETTICTQFNWPWLSFPAALVVLSVISLVLTIIPGTNQPPAWKSSILPFLHFLDPVERDFQR